MSSGYSPYRKFLSCIFPADAGEGEQSAFVIASLIQDYTNEVSNLLAEFRRAVENGGSRDIGLSMHSLRSNSKLFGAARLADLYRSLEIAAQTKRNTWTRGFSRIFCKLAKHLDSRLQPVFSKSMDAGCGVFRCSCTRFLRSIRLKPNVTEYSTLKV